MKKAEIVLMLLCSLLVFRQSALATDGRGTILVVGDSLTAGYGLEFDEAYPAVLQKWIDRAGLPFEIVNAGVSGDTSAGGAGRIAWLLKRKVDVLLLELGANDGLRGISLDSTKRNLQTIIDEVLKSNPKARIVVAGMQVPPNLGPEYTSRFRTLFEELADENQAILIPFLLESVAGRPEFNLPDGIHPTREGHEIVAENVWKRLGPVLRELSKDTSN